MASSRVLALVVASIAAGTLGLSACSNGQDPAPAPTASTTMPAPLPAPDLAADLNGRTFTSTAISGHQLVPNSAITLNFTDTMLSARAGCNTMGGQYTVDAGLLTWTTPRSTMMACDPPLMDQDRWLSALLSDGVSISLAGPNLVLSAEGTRIELTEQQAAPTQAPTS